MMKLYLSTCLRNKKHSNFSALTALITKPSYTFQPLLTSQPVPNPLLQMPQYGFKRAFKKIPNTDFDQELKEYKVKMSDMRKKHRKEYWEAQTQVENLYLERFHREKLEKQRRDLDRWRTSICNISMHTKNRIQYLENQEKDMLMKMRDADIRDMKRAMENRIMLDVMTIDSNKWPTLLDLHQRVDENVLLPQTVLNYGEYQKKLQNLAFYAEQGDHENMQKLLDKEDIMEKKNLLLQPLYRDLKSMIKHMTYTEEYRLIKEYMDGRQLILANTPIESEKGKEGVAKLEQEYARLLQNYRKSLNDPTKKLKTLQIRLEDMFQLLSLWSQYIEVIYMSESEIHIIDTIRKLDARPEETSHHFRTEERDIDFRLKTLFGKEDSEALDDQDPSASKKSMSDTLGGGEAGYETVNEGMTTDTTEASGVTKRGSLEKELDLKKEDTKSADKDDEEGILSSDEEIPKDHPGKRRNINSKLDNIIGATKDQIKAFEPTAEDRKSKKEKGNLEENRDQMETKYHYSEQDIEQYSAKLETMAERDRARQQANAADEEDRDYVQDTSYSKSAMDALDMHSLNLFGIPIDSTDSTTDDLGSQETKQVLQDLIDMADQLDNSDLSNFNVRKSFVYYDPYEPDESITYSFLKFEDNLKLRASIVLDYYKQEINAFDVNTLTYAEKERKEKVLKLIDQLTQLKVVDAQVLMKIYDLYRFKI